MAPLSMTSESHRKHPNWRPSPAPRLGYLHLPVESWSTKLPAKFQQCVGLNSMRRRGVCTTARRWTLSRSRCVVAVSTMLARIAMRRSRGMRLRFGRAQSGIRGRFCAEHAEWRRRSGNIWSASRAVRDAGRGL